MILLTDRNLFTAAIKKARQVKPVVTMIEFGVYSVWGAATNYTVEFGKVNGQFGATCTCPAHTKSKGGPKMCYHICSAYSSHAIQVAIRRQVKAAAATSVSNWIVSDGKEAA